MKASSSDACCGVSSWIANPLRSGEVADLCGLEALDLEQAVPVERRDRHLGPGEELGEPGRLRRADAHDVPRGLLDEVLGARVRDHAAAADHDQVVGGERHLAHQVRRDEHRPSLGREPLQQVAHPVDALRVEPVDRLVEHHRVRVAEERRGDPEPLAHPERELARALLRDLVEPDEVDQLVDAALRDAVRLGEREQVVVGRAAGVDGARLEQRADLVQRRRVVAVVLAVDRHVARGGGVEPEDQPHRGRLPGPVRPEEAGHDARPHGEREVVDGPLLPVVLRQALGFDHAPDTVPAAR